MKKILLVIRPENTESENQGYILAIEKFGCEVLFVDDNDSWDKVLEVLKDVDGILLPGGNDVGKLDYLLIEYAFTNKIKLLGICQGMQSMAMYGSSDRLISIGNSSHYSKEKYCHEVVIDDTSRFYEMVKEKVFQVNSYHHESVLKSHCFKVVGKSSDGLIEVIESIDGLQIGVQWHPERMYGYDLISFKLLEKFFDNM